MPGYGVAAMKNLPTKLHRIANSLQLEVGCAAQILIRKKAPASWKGRNKNKVSELLSFSSPLVIKQAEFINRRQLAF